MTLFGSSVPVNNTNKEKMWKKAVQTMSNPDAFLKKVKEYNGDHIDQHILDNVNKIINDPSKNFNKDKILTQNFAAAYLCSWAVNIVSYNRIFREV
jgi:dynein heavy chain